MSFIFIPTISSHKLNQAQFYNKSSVPLPGISIGEILEAGVIEKIDDQKMLITLKGISMQADSEVRLNAGDRIQVKVETLQPQLVLRIMEGGYSEESGLSDYLKWHRSNPEALSNMMTEAVRQFNSADLGKLLRYLPRADFQKIVGLLKLLLFSTETKGTNFLKDYLGKLGLTMESQLRNVIEGRSNIDGGDLQPENLKGLLTELSSDLHNLLMSEDSLDGEKEKVLENLSKYVDSSIKTIESQQIINVILQEAESKYLFQIPIVFPDGVRKSDIFIEYDRHSKKEGEKGRYRVIFFLSMDILGDMIIDTELNGGKIDCVMKCADQGVCDFISSFLEELRGSLLALGCKIDMVKCVTGADLVTEKLDYYQDRVLYNRDVIDLFA
ncbi:MAG: hypothetical protein ABSG75_07060 [Syntrophales bacterium]|jgi:hypothetical protein